MRVTTKGQVTIPVDIREKLGITPYTDVEFAEKDGLYYLVKETVENKPRPKKNKFRKLRGIASIKMSTDEIMALTRGRK